MEKRKRGSEGRQYPHGLQPPQNPPSRSIQAGPTQDAAYARSESEGPRWEDPGQSGPASVGHDDETVPQTRSRASPGSRLLASHESDDSDEDRTAGMEMVDNADKGKPVLSGPAALGLRRDSRQTKSPEPQDSTQLQRSGRDKSSLPTPDSQVLFGTSLYDPDDETTMAWEHGRRYCRDYFMPNDEDEQDRLRILHQIYLNIFNLELTTITLENPTMVLDVGTGTGEWALGAAETWPDCKVIGIDISPTFERAVPLNCHFQVMDGEDPWPWPDNSFDMVHYRHMSGTFRDWSSVYKETLRCLKPGGWIEILEFHDHEGEKNFYDRFPPHSMMHQAAKDIERAEVKHGKHRGIDHMEPGLLERNGFVDCEVHEHIIPLDPSNSPLGKLWLVTLRAGFESYSLRLLTKYMGWDAATVRATCDSVGQQMIAMATNPNLNKGFQIRLRVTIAKKPVEESCKVTPGLSAPDPSAEKSGQEEHEVPSPPPSSSSQTQSSTPGAVASGPDRSSPDLLGGGV